MILDLTGSGGYLARFMAAWVTAPNTAGLLLAANTPATLALNTEIYDPGTLITVGSSKITTSPEAAGDYEIYAWTNGFRDASSVADIILNVVDVTGGGATVLASGGTTTNHPGAINNNISAYGLVQSLAASREIELRAACASTATVGVGTTAFSLSTAGYQWRAWVEFRKIA